MMKSAKNRNTFATCSLVSCSGVSLGVSLFCSFNCGYAISMPNSEGKLPNVANAKLPCAPPYAFRPNAAAWCQYGCMPGCALGATRCPAGRGGGELPARGSSPCARPRPYIGVTVSRVTEALHTGHWLAPPARCRIQRHKQDQQYKWPQRVTTGSCGVSKQMLHSNKPPFELSLLVAFTPSLSVRSLTSSGSSVIVADVIPAPSPRRRIGTVSCSGRICDRDNAIFVRVRVRLQLTQTGANMTSY